jgi:hypothetical protein
MALILQVNVYTNRTKTNKIKITTEKLKKMNNTKNRAEPGADKG